MLDDKKLIFVPAAERRNVSLRKLRPFRSAGGPLVI